MKFICSCLIFIFFLSMTSTAAKQNDKSCDFDMKISVAKDNLNYKVSIGSTPWLYSGDTWFQIGGKRYSTEDNSFKFLDYVEDIGRDSMGRYNYQRFTYVARENIYFYLFVLEYTETPLILFGQNYVNETAGTSVGYDNLTSSGFPSFDISKTTVDLGYFAANGYFSGWDQREFGKWNPKSVKLPSGQNLGPIALFDKHNNAVIMSHFMEFMGASTYYDANKTTLYYGPLGRAEKIPENFLIWQMLYHSCHGINKAFQGWGDALKAFYKSKNEDFAKTDFVNNYLGYWTDNGAFYYYNTEKNKTYEQTMMDVASYLRNENIPARYLQYDSWWYPKDENGGILKWVAEKELFPDGMGNVMQKTGLGATGHIKWWSPKTPLAKQNGGKYDFYMEKGMALPLDLSFYRDMFSDSRRWGNQVVNQDWLGQWFNGLDALRTNVTIGKQFMDLLNHGALENGMTLEICTAYPRHVLAAVEMNAVTINRVSGDYNPGVDQWDFGEISAYVSALGQSPFKDAFWTTSDQNCPKYPGKRERFPAFQSIVASLTAGPVAFGDGIGKTDKQLLMRCCSESGLILKPSVPATSIDGVFLQKAFQDGSGPNGTVWTTYSKFGPFTFGIIFAVELKDPYVATPDSLGFTEWMTDYDYIVYPYDNPAKSRLFSAKSPLKLSNCTKDKFCLFYVSPVFDMGGNKITLLGELTKWIPLSPKRISDITIFGGDLQATLRGLPNEIVSVTASINGKIIKLNCQLNASGMALWSVGNSCH